MVCNVASRWRVEGRIGPLLLWLLMWMNSVVKARSMTAADFDIDDIGGPVMAEHILPAGYTDPDDAVIPLAKIRAQQRHTVGQLEPLVRRLPSAGPVTPETAAPAR